MNCDTCNREFNYAFYINDEYWRKVVGGDRFKNRVGRICAHCTLQSLGGLDWYIIHNEPAEKITAHVREAAAERLTP